MKTMKTIILGAVFAAVCFGQANTLTPTTLSAAVTSGSAKTIVVTSATGITAPSTASNPATVIYIDQELMAVQAVSGTTITVQRGASGTYARSHASGALVFFGAPQLFGSSNKNNGGGAASGACTRANLQVVPFINVTTGEIADCLGGSFIKGVRTSAPPFRVQAIPNGGTAYTAINTNGTALDSTHLFCTELNLPENKLLTGLAILNGTTVGTDKHLLILYDSAGNAIANSAVAGALSASASVYQQYAFTSTYYAIGPAQYFACTQSNGATDTVRMAVTGATDNVLTKSQASSTFGTVAALTVPTTFTTAVGPLFYAY